MWVLYGKYVVNDEFLDFYRTVRMPYRTRSQAVKGSRQFRNNCPTWIPKMIQWEPWCDS